jgi:hypothetical protein
VTTGGQGDLVAIAVGQDGAQEQRIAAPDSVARTAKLLSGGT